MRASRGLKWENKMYKLKRSIAVLQGYSLKSAGGSTALGGGGGEGARLFLCHSNIHISSLCRCRYHRAWLKLPFCAFNLRDHISQQIAAIFVCSRECYLWQADRSTDMVGRGEKGKLSPVPIRLNVQYRMATPR